MKLQKDIKPTVKVPIRGNNGFYKCPCGNRFTDYNSQAKCEACGAVLDWENVLVTEAELGQDVMDRKVGRSKKCKSRLNY